MAGGVRCQAGPSPGLHHRSRPRLHRPSIHGAPFVKRADGGHPGGDRGRRRGGEFPWSRDNREPRMDPLEHRTIAKVSKRLVPFLIVCYFVAYLDRVNVSFAAVTMNADLGLSASAFGFGAGIFFLAYFFFEVPSNLF